MGSEEGHNISTFLKQLAQIQFGEHNILVYEDIASFRQTMSKWPRRKG